MGRSWTVEVGHSTRALDAVDTEQAVTAALAAGGNIVELSTRNGEDLDAVTAAAQGFARRTFRRVSVHAPAEPGQVPEAELANRLASLGVPIVIHPQSMTDPAPWRQFGRRLLLENTDGGAPGASAVTELADAFVALPDAGFCLDVSHALHAGGPALVDELAVAFASRLEEIHVGCACGEGCGDHLEGPVLDAVSRVLRRAGRPLPIVIQRPVHHRSEALAQVYAARTALVTSLGTRDAA